MDGINSEDDEEVSWLASGDEGAAGDVPAADGSGDEPPARREDPVSLVVDAVADELAAAIDEMEGPSHGSRGNFYLSFAPGDERWLPHNRISARRIQGMGFRDAADGEKQDGAWMSSVTQSSLKRLH
eukprot:s2101_g20.t1